MATRYYLMTLGCQMNLSDGERIHTLLKGMGMEECDRESDAGVVGILACSVRQKAIDKVYNQIATWNREKNHRNLLTFITGCILPDDRERFLKLFDLVFPMSEASALPEMIRTSGVVSPASLDYFREGNTSSISTGNEGIPTNKKIFSLWDIRPDYRSEFEAFIPIQNGCNKFCTFCAVPYTRGREVSRPSSEILAQLESLIDNGYKSITLLGQNVNSYGLDRQEEEVNFAQLLDKAGQLAMEKGKECWIYYTSPHPRDINEEVIEVMSRYTHIAKQVHLPMQSGDDKVLVKMNRNHSLERFRELVTLIRKHMPEASLFTDIITGFTGESEEQHQNTVEAMKEFKFNMAYVAQYSPRPGAASYRWEDTVPKEDKNRRMHELNQILQETAREDNLRRIGTSQRVLVTGADRKPGHFKGLTEGKINVRFPGSQHSLVGTFVDVEIEGSNGLSLEGKLVPLDVQAIAPRSLVTD